MKKQKIVSILCSISFLNFGFIYLAINLSALTTANRIIVCRGEERAEVTYFHSLSPAAQPPSLREVLNIDICQIYKKQTFSKGASGRAGHQCSTVGHDSSDSDVSGFIRITESFIYKDIQVQKITSHGKQYK